MADRSRDPEALEREIVRTREQLAQTIDALADRVSPRNVAHRSAERLREEGAQVARTAHSVLYPPDEEGEPGPLDRKIVYAGVAVAAVTVALLWAGRRRRHR